MEEAVLQSILEQGIVVARMKEAVQVPPAMVTAILILCHFLMKRLIK